MIPLPARFRKPPTVSPPRGPVIPSSTLRGGVYRWNGVRWDLFLPLPGEYLTLIGFADDRAGNGTFCGRIGRSLNRIEWTPDGTVTRTPLTPSGMTLATDRDGRGNVLTLEQSGDAILRQHGVWTPLDPMPPELIGATSIRFDARGDLWVGKTNGLHVCRLSSGVWKRLTVPGQGPVNTVNAMLFTRTVRSGSGPRTGSWCIATTSGSRRSSPSATSVSASSRAWPRTGTDISGSRAVHRSAAPTGGWLAWRHFGAAEGFSDNGVHRITRDRKGRLWFLTISFFSPGKSTRISKTAHSSSMECDSSGWTVVTDFRTAACMPWWRTLPGRTGSRPGRGSPGSGMACGHTGRSNRGSGRTRSSLLPSTTAASGSATRPRVSVYRWQRSAHVCRPRRRIR